MLYRALEAHTKSDDDPLGMHEANNLKRNDLRDDIVANLRRQPLGALKVEAFNYLLDYVMRFLEHRDDERHFVDRSTYSLRAGFQEVNRRVRERGRLDTDRDFWFLTRPELYAVLDGTYDETLTRAKIAGRMHNFDRFNTKQYAPPKFLKDNRAYAEHIAELGRRCPARPSDELRFGDRHRPGHPRTGRHRPGEPRRHLDRQQHRPGLDAGVRRPRRSVTETGGMLSHSSCLTREYRFPAAQVENAMRLIPDGAPITVNGDTGQVIVVAQPAG